MNSFLETTNTIFSPFYPVERYEGPVLTIPRVTPDDFGAYLCIAKNGVHPASSKRVVLNVQCKKFLDQLIILTFLRIRFKFYHIIYIIVLPNLTLV